MSVRPSNPPPLGRHREPKLPTGKDMDGHPFGRLHYRRFDGDLFVKGRISAHHVGQGDLGDCFFLASLAALAQTHPTKVRDAINDNGDGTYTVTFQERVGGRARAVPPIRIDTKFPVDIRGAQLFGKGLRGTADRQELWPALFEKAYAAWQGGYIRIDLGGEGGVALTRLTGKPSKTTTPNRYSADRLWTKLRRAKAAGNPMLTSTPFARELRKRTGRDDLDGLIEDHFYVVLGAFERRGQRRVRLYTPLVDFTDDPVSTPSRGQDGQRTKDLALEDFRRDFDQLVVNDMSG